MQVQGRWRKEVKDIMPNKKADGRFEVCGSARSAIGLWRLFFLFRSKILIPCESSRRRATPL